MTNTHVFPPADIPYIFPIMDRRRRAQVRGLLLLLLPLLVLSFSFPSPPAVLRRAAQRDGRRGNNKGWRKKLKAPWLVMPLAAEPQEGGGSGTAALQVAPTPPGDARGSQPNGTGGTVVVGGGPIGLATAIMLARRGYKDIRVYERLSRFPKPDDTTAWGDPSRSYNLGIGGRGQEALIALDAWDRVDSYCATVLGRMDWSPKSSEPNERIMSERKYTTKVIARDRLAAALLQEVEEKYGDSVSVSFDTECTSVQWQTAEGGVPVGAGGKVGDSAVVARGPGETSTLTMTPTTKGEGEDRITEALAECPTLVVGTDGVGSAMRDSMGLRGRRFEDTNRRVYKTMPFTLPPGHPKYRNDVNYSYRKESGLTLEALPTKEGTQVGLLLYKPGDEEVAAVKTQEDAEDLFTRNFPELSQFMTKEDYRRFAERPESSLPGFSYCSGALHRGGGAVLLGDAIHTVKPYFGLGLNSGLEDVMELNACLEEKKDVSAAALQLFSKRRAKEAKALVDMSRTFDTQGIRAAVTFIIPIILDSIFHQKLPKLFAPNTISFLQQPQNTFTAVRRRKRMDRLGQVGIIAAALTAALRVGLFVGKQAIRLVPV